MNVNWRLDCFGRIHPEYLFSLFRFSCKMRHISHRTFQSWAINFPSFFRKNCPPIVFTKTVSSISIFSLGNKAPESEMRIGDYTHDHRVYSLQLGLVCFDHRCAIPVTECVNFIPLTSCEKTDGLFSTVVMKLIEVCLSPTLTNFLSSYAIHQNRCCNCIKRIIFFLVSKRLQIPFNEIAKTHYLLLKYIISHPGSDDRQLWWINIGCITHASWGNFGSSL